MSYIVVDVESDGPAPGIYSMVCFGAIVVEPSLSKTFYGEVKPISELWIPEALAVSGFSREEHLKFEDPLGVMLRFKTWLKQNSQNSPIFISDNNGFDWSFINFYFHKYLRENPFGYSSRRIGDLYAGMQMDATSKTNREWKKLFRKTKHTHNPVADARGNAEALLELKKRGLNILI